MPKIFNFELEEYYDYEYRVLKINSKYRILKT